MNININCLSCGHKIELDSAYSDYEGLVSCVVCSTRLEIKTEDGSIRSVKEGQPSVSAANASNHPGDSWPAANR